MIPRCLLVLLTCLASGPVALGQQHGASPPHNLSAARVQAPAATTVDFRQQADLTKIPEYRNLVEEFQQTQAQLDRLLENLSSAGIEDYGDHFHFANLETNNELFQL